MEITEIGVLSLEAAASLLVFVIAAKIYKMKISTSSGCCGDRFHVETSNPGSSAFPFDNNTAV